MGLSIRPVAERDSGAASGRPCGTHLKTRKARHRRGAAGRHGEPVPVPRRKRCRSTPPRRGDGGANRSAARSGGRRGACARRPRQSSTNRVPPRTAGRRLPRSWLRHGDPLPARHPKRGAAPPGMKGRRGGLRRHERGGGHASAGKYTTPVARRTEHPGAKTAGKMPALPGCTVVDRRRFVC